MLKVGLVGIGFMGRGHLDQYLRLMSENAGVTLVAICEVDEKKFAGEFVSGNGNLDFGGAEYDFSKFNLYTDFDAMIEKEALDYVDIALPTYLHSRYAIKALNAGLNVLCEKPMAMNPVQCQMMIDAAQKNGKKLMIGQCLRFWPDYEALKAVVDSGELGKPVCCYFYRGGGTPVWSYEDWLRDEVRSGGCLLDQHIHDVDMLNWLFGAPEAVSCIGRNVHPGSGFDAMSTNYRYDGFVANTQDDWAQNGDGAPFMMMYRCNFEKGSINYINGKTTIYPLGGTMREVESVDDGYYREIKYFIDAIINDKPIETASPESTRMTIVIATAERESALKNGEWVCVKA